MANLSIFEMLGMGAGGLSQGYMAGRKLVDQEQKEINNLKLQRDKLKAEEDYRKTDLEIKMEQLKANLERLKAEQNRPTPVGKNLWIPGQGFVQGPPEPQKPETRYEKLSADWMEEKRREEADRKSGVAPGMPQSQPSMLPSLLMGTPPPGLEVSGAAPTQAAPMAAPQADTRFLTTFGPKGPTFREAPEKAPPKPDKITLNEFTNAAGRLGLDPAKHQSWTKEQHDALEEYVRVSRSKTTGGRAGEATQAKLDVLTMPENVGKEAERQSALVTAQTKARKQVGLEYLPTEVRIRAQEALNIATDPENIKSVAAKIEAEERSRQGAKYAPESVTGPIVLLQTTEGALSELKTKFTPEQRQKFVGIFQNPILRAKQIAKGDPEFATFQALMGRIKKSAFDDGGKQLTPFEFSVVKQYIPQGDENSWQDFEAKLAIAGDYTRMLIDGRTSIAGVTRKQLSTEGAPPLKMGGKGPGGPTPAEALKVMSNEELLRKLEGK